MNKKTNKKMNKKIRYATIIFSTTILLIFITIIVMAIFKLCPPIESGPQPPWCMNEERFDRDFKTTSLTSALKKTIITIMPIKQNPESKYDAETNPVEYIEIPKRINDYEIEFGVAPSDFFWPVCQTFKDCIDPRRNIKSTFSRINSIGSDFVVITDYARITTNKKIYEDKYALTNKQIQQKMKHAENHDLKTMILINLFLDEKSVRESRAETKTENARVFEKDHQLLAMSNWAPNEEEMNHLFDEWEKIAITKTKKWNNANYIVINPEDLHFHFTTHPELMNERNNQLIKKIRETYKGKICVHFKELNYLKKYEELNYYKNADCIIIGGHIQFEDVTNTPESFEKFFNTYFQDEFFNNEEQEIYQMISTMSYNKYLEEGWFEIWDYDALNLNYEPDFKLQANAYEGFFRAIQKTQPNLKGIFHYGYWWEDVDFNKDPLNAALMNSIRNKDAEHIYNRWSQVLKK